MPFLRVIRDKRGYETTYLMHWYREGARQRSRILYVFRTPGGVRVGRDPLEPDVLRTLEVHHPDIQFDWKAVLENRQVIESAPEQRKVRKGRHSEEKTAAPPPPASEPELAPRTEASPALPSRPPVPAALEGITAEEQLAFLALWYGRVRDRIAQASGDDARKDALFALAERLNPAPWNDADQIASGLQHADDALERLSRVFAKRRRRPRKPKGAGRPDGAPEPSPDPDEASEPSPRPDEVSEPAPGALSSEE